MPDFTRSRGRKHVREEDNAAEVPVVAGEDAPDAGLIAPDEECSVCLNAVERPNITPCSHWFCWSVPLYPLCLPHVLEIFSVCLHHGERGLIIL